MLVYDFLDEIFILLLCFSLIARASLILRVKLGQVGYALVSHAQQEPPS